MRDARVARARRSSERLDRQALAAHMSVGGRYFCGAPLEGAPQKVSRICEAREALAAHMSVGGR